MDLPERILALHRALGEIPHAFGGALALAWCTDDPRGTSDIDLNVFLPADAVDRTVNALPEGIGVTRKQLSQFRRDGQVRVFWDETPVDLFLNTTDFHAEAAHRVVVRPFGGEPLPFLGCSDLAVFKAFFNRTKDWADLEAMEAAGRLDQARVAAELVRYLGADDPRVARVIALRS